MKQYSIHEVKKHFSALLDKVANGESFVIAKAGKPFVRVIPCEEAKKVPRVGFLRNQITVPDDFDSALQTEAVKIFEAD